MAAAPAAQSSRRAGTDTSHISCSTVRVDDEQGIRVRERDAKPTARQVSALAVELARYSEIEFPRTRGAASDLIERLRSGAPDEEAAER